MAAVAILDFQKVQFFNGEYALRANVHPSLQISSRLVDSLLRYGVFFRFFKTAAGDHLAF